MTLAYTTLPTSRNLSFRSCQEVLKLKLEMKHRFLNGTRRLHTAADTTELAVTAFPFNPASRGPAIWCAPAAFTRMSVLQEDSEARLWPAEIPSDYGAVDPSQLSFTGEYGLHASAEAH